jgi:hypothetical protein
MILMLITSLVLMVIVPTVSAGTVNRTYVVSFAGSPVELAGFDSTIRLWFAVFTIIFVAMFAGASHAPQVAVVDCVLAWIYTGIGWLNPLMEGVNAKYGTGGEAVLMIMLCFATFYAILWNFREGKRKEKGT